MLCVLFPRRLNNCRRVAYEEVRLPPVTNQRCDLYVDDEVEVSLKLWENLFGNRPDSGHVIKLRKRSLCCERLCFHSDMVCISGIGC